MPTTIITLLNGSTNGFTNVSSGSYDSATVFPIKVTAYDSLAVSGDDLTAYFQQGSSINTYEDLGVPSGAIITGLKFLDAYNTISSGSGVTAQYEIYTDEAYLVSRNFGFADEGDVKSVSKLSNEFVRFYIAFSGSVVFDPEGSSYGSLELSVGQIQIEVTYTLQEKNVDGTISSDLQMSGSLYVNTHVNGTITSDVSLAGALSVGLFVSGTIVSSVELSGSIYYERSVSGTSTGTTELTGVLERDTIAYISGLVTGLTSLEGGLTGGISGTRLSQEIAGRKYLSPSTKRIIRNQS